MPATHCFGSVQACAMRVGMLDDAGAPDPGANNLYVTDSLIQVQTSYEIETGEEFIQKNGCGAICQNFKEPDILKRVTLELQLCQYDYELLSMMIGGTLIEGDVVTGGANAPIGLVLPSSSAPASNGVSLEIWSKAWDGGSQAVSNGGDALYHHFAWPKTTWVPGQRTIAQGILVIPVSGIGTENPTIGDGPVDDWPIWGPEGPELSFLDTEIPTAQCGSQELVAS